MPEQNGAKLSPPWNTYYRMVSALFDDDPEVAVLYSDDDGLKVTLLVDNAIKAEAIAALMPTEKDFGGVVLRIEVVPANEGDSKDVLFRRAFEGNPVLSRVEVAEGVFTNPACYVAFEPEIVQFWNDELGDLNGMRTMLHQDVAREVFGEQPGVFFCTDLIDE